MRVVSLLPSATEIVAALGHGGELVGRSAECDYPPDVEQLPIVMKPRTLDSERPSSEIDARVRKARSAGESLYRLDVDRLRELRPDVLFTQELCGVCSVTAEEVRAACRSAGISPAIVSLAPTTLTEVFDSILTVGEALADRPAAERLVSELRERCRPSRTPREARPRVAIVEWLDPPILAGLWSSDMVDRAGGVPIGPPSREPGRRTTWGAVERGAPDLVVLSPCSFSVDRTRRELSDPALLSRVKGACGRLGTVLADEAYFSRPGPRLADGVSLLRQLLKGSLREPPLPAEYLVSDRARAPA